MIVLRPGGSTPLYSLYRDMLLDRILCVLNLLFDPKRASQAQIKPKWESAFLSRVRARKSDSEVKHSLCCHYLENDQYGTILAKNF